MAGKYYVVWAGRVPGIYTSWGLAEKQVKGFSGAKFKGFKTKAEAEEAFGSPVKKTATAGESSAVGANNASVAKAQASNVSSHSVTTDVAIYCDGGCDPNPGKAGTGVAVYRKGVLEELWYGLYNPMGTNNTAELNGLHQSLVIAKQDIAKGNTVEIFCDSSYSVNSITVWASGWEKKGWTRGKNKELMNAEMIKEIYYLYVELKESVKVSHVKAHIGIEGNELADRMSIHAIAVKDSEFSQYSETLDIERILKMREG